MKTIIFIGTNKSGSSREAIKAAEQLGYFTVLFTNNEKQINQREEYTDVHEMIFMDTSDLSKMKEEINKLRARGLEICTILSFVDSYVYIASILCDEFCKSYTPAKTIKIMENKEDTRVALTNQLYTPKFLIIKPGERLVLDTLNKTLTYPVIIKSSNSTGSKDVLLAEGAEQAEKHILKLREKNVDEAIIIEEFIEGDQYLVEALIYNSKIHIAGVIEQEITQGKRFIITGYGVLVHVPYNMRKELEDVLQSIISKLEIKNGALHLEMRRSKNGWMLIEINPRISGGAMNKMLKAAYGYNLVEETIKLHVGEQPSIIPKHQKHIFTQYLIVSDKGILEKVTGKKRARKSPGVVEVYVKPRKGTRLIPPLSMGHRYAYVIAEGRSKEEAKRNAKNAASEIKFHLQEEK